MGTWSLWELPRMGRAAKGALTQHSWSVSAAGEGGLGSKPHSQLAASYRSCWPGRVDADPSLLGS